MKALPVFLFIVSATYVLADQRCNNLCMRGFARCITSNIRTPDMNEAAAVGSQCVTEMTECLNQCLPEPTQVQADEDCVDVCTANLDACIKQGTDECMEQCNGELGTPCMQNCFIDKFSTCITDHQSCFESCVKPSAQQRQAMSQFAITDPCELECKDRLQTCVKNDVLDHCLRQCDNVECLKSCGLGGVAQCIGKNGECVRACHNERQQALLIEGDRAVLCKDRLWLRVRRIYPTCRQTCEGMRRQSARRVCMRNCVLDELLDALRDYDRCDAGAFRVRRRRGF